MSNNQLSRYYQLRRKIMGYYLGKTEVRPTSQENSEYVKLFNLKKQSLYRRLFLWSLIILK